METNVGLDARKFVVFFKIYDPKMMENSIKEKSDYWGQVDLYIALG